MQDPEILDDSLSEEGESSIRDVRDAIQCLISSLLFGLGYIMLLFCGYYHYNYLYLTSIGRKDLIAGLEFLSYNNGFLFYPLSFVLLAVLAWTAYDKKVKNLKTKVLYGIVGLLIVAVPFYTHSPILDLFFLSMESWTIGILLVFLSFYILTRKFKRKLL